MPGCCDRSFPGISRKRQSPLLHLPILVEEMGRPGRAEHRLYAGFPAAIKIAVREQLMQPEKKN